MTDDSFWIFDLICRNGRSLEAISAGERQDHAQFAIRLDGPSYIRRTVEQMLVSHKCSGTCG